MAPIAQKYQYRVLWGLSEVKYQELVNHEKTKNIPSMIMVYDAANGGQYQTYIRSDNPDLMEKFKDVILKYLFFVDKDSLVIGWCLVVSYLAKLITNNQWFC